MAEISAILADWGTTNRRAWAVDRDGNVLDQRKDDQGLLGVKDRAFEASFRGFIGDWLKAATPAAPIVMAGMVGSKLGWREAPYVAAPARFGQLAEHLVALPDVDGHPIRIAPGFSAREDGRPDVMRGEECQLYGLWLSARADRLCVLPGTHSKWAGIRNGGLDGFRTYMTGELFSQLCGSGTLAQLMQPDAPHDAAAFQRGLSVSEGASAGALLNRLFSVRSLGLFGELPGEALASYLSGLLIGAELRDATVGLDGSVAVIGSSRMNGLYVSGLSAIGVEAEPIDGDPLLRTALLAIARDAGLL
ncbi:2-dehydro-3-deoxygalactonokinase [Dongia sedimenti]|uniref:2-dehydro-3-deoxygalactonokinase n=1 Tax=Dongia sedimenti TaxID=3064282 RepID=A0ABU0YK00_9PROT|nr:2-dehydro-3-deoxygalactonokinase [Rhodospirillaceae bacterium R-7]